MIAAMPVRLMIVDDPESVRELLRAIVEDAPDDVVLSGEADGAEAALATIDGVDPDARESVRRPTEVRGRRGGSSQRPVLVGYSPTQAGRYARIRRAAGSLAALPSRS